MTKKELRNLIKESVKEVLHEDFAMDKIKQWSASHGLIVTKRNQKDAPRGMTVSKDDLMIINPKNKKYFFINPKNVGKSNIHYYEKDLEGILK